MVSDCKVLAPQNYMVVVAVMVSDCEVRFHEISWLW